MPKKYAGLGGRGLTSQILLDEVEPTCHPLAKGHLCAGTADRHPGGQLGRLSVGGKSPFTGGIKEANSGGVSAQKLASLGYKAVIVEGIPEVLARKTRRLDSADLGDAGTFGAYPASAGDLSAWLVASAHSKKDDRPISPGAIVLL